MASTRVDPATSGGGSGDTGGSGSTGSGSSSGGGGAFGGAVLMPLAFGAMLRRRRKK
jgi:hypothetical protein